jgi:membrane protein required for beta-lactamase induction
MILVGVFLPAINGPHLWFGLPSLMIWIALCTVVCTGVMLSYETLLRSAR